MSSPTMRDKWDKGVLDDLYKDTIRRSSNGELVISLPLYSPEPDEPFRQRASTLPGRFMSDSKEKIKSKISILKPTLASYAKKKDKAVGFKECGNDQNTLNIKSPRCRTPRPYTDYIKSPRSGTPRPHPDYFKSPRCGTPRPHPDLISAEDFRPRARTLSPTSLYTLRRPSVDANDPLPPITRTRRLARSFDRLPEMEDGYRPSPLPPILKKSQAWTDHDSSDGSDDEQLSSLGVLVRPSTPLPTWSLIEDVDIASQDVWEATSKKLSPPSKRGMMLRIERSPLPTGSDALRKVFMELGENEESGVSMSSSPPKRLLDRQHLNVSTTIASKDSTHKSILIKDGNSYYIGSEKLSTSPKALRRVHWNDITDIIGYEIE